MPASSSVLIDLGKLKNLNSGLGQVSWQYGVNLLKINQLQKKPFRFTYLVPAKVGGIVAPHAFGEGVGLASLALEESSSQAGGLGFEYLSLKRRFFPQWCPRYALWHAIHQDSPYFPADRRTPYILTIHDLNFMQEKSPAKAQKYLHNLQKKVNRAQAITFISQYSEATARQHLKLPDVPIQVVYNGIDISEAPPQKPDFAPQGKFLLAIGIISAKKNLAVLPDFLALLPDYQLVIAGDNRSEYAQAIQKNAWAKGVQNRLVLPGMVSEAEKNWLYQHCEALVFPSKNEGFGMPAIEAMRFGKPVFLSTYSALPEIGGDLAFYWQNFEASYMAQVFREKMLYFQQNPNMSQDLRQYAQRFSWENNVNQYLQLYRQILNIKE
ncbi:MAG: glycosyltransferase family 4 protein [Microscillaceae bacterium]|jgi:glycosyltransferase involved in cell wall biosynthesis|nr:glycosyltransferase family 4 protein [Microscillaceae bacterium]